MSENKICRDEFMINGIFYVAQGCGRTQSEAYEAMKHQKRYLIDTITKPQEPTR